MAIPGLLKRLQIRGQAIEADGIDSWTHKKVQKYRLWIRIRMKRRKGNKIIVNGI
jgi:hypothetical protein